ncbi:MAG: hypothetical protein Q7S80_01300 [bacterium]|nr:hypothetical protein [bacterium]
MQKKRGSAIVIAMLLVTAVGAVGFTFGKVLNIQITNETLYENGVGAYYSAESGIEEGFLRYRYSRDSQIPSILTSANWLTLSNNVTRANLTSVQVLKPNVDKSNIATTALDISDPNSQFYDLRMGSASPLGSPAGSVSGNSNLSNPALDPNYSDFHIARDETKKIDLESIFNVGDDITLSFKASNPIISPERPAVLQQAKCVLIEVKLELQQIQNGPIIEKKKLLKNPVGCSYSGSPDNIITDYTTTLDYVYDGATGIATIAGLKNAIAPTISYYRAILFLKPIGSDIDYSLQETGSAVAQNPLNGANSVITSTGYFGGINRTLEADIDLTNGSLYDLYDFVIYKN